ncbi:MAG: hypothetical protein RL660_2126 [Bacteroidota bacterium]
MILLSIFALLFAGLASCDPEKIVHPAFADLPATDTAGTGDTAVFRYSNVITRPQNGQNDALVFATKGIASFDIDIYTITGTLSSAQTFNPALLAQSSNFNASDADASRAYLMRVEANTKQGHKIAFVDSVYILECRPSYLSASSIRLADQFNAATGSFTLPTAETSFLPCP